MINKSFIVTLKEYAEFTTINGVLYIVDAKFSRLSQVFWFLVGIALIAISILLINQGYNNWQSDPILTTVSTTGYPISKIDYPAITICGLGMVDSVVEDAIFSQVVRYIKQNWKEFDFKLSSGESFLDLFAKNGLTYADFVTEEYPGMPVTSSLRELFLEEARQFILNTTTEKLSLDLQQGMSYDMVLNANNLTWADFMSENYPDLENDPILIFHQISEQLCDRPSYFYCGVSISGQQFDNASLQFDLFPIFGINFEDYINTYYPLESKFISAAHLLSFQVIRFINNKTIITLQNSQSPLDLFNSFEVNYTNFLHINYPVFAQSPETDIKKIMHLQVTEYIRKKTVLQMTLQGNQTYRDLFTMNRLNYSNFVNEMYPGLDENVNLNDLIPLLASPHPDAFLLSKIAVSGTYAKSQNVTQSFGGPCYGSEYEYDSDNNICYRLAGRGSMDQIRNGEFCRQEEGEDLFSFDNDKQLVGFLNVVNNSDPICAISQEDRIPCLPLAWSSQTGIYSDCTVQFCCYLKDSTGEYCYHSASLHILKEDLSDNITFTVRNSIYLPPRSGHGVWVNLSNSLREAFTSYKFTSNVLEPTSYSSESEREGICDMIIYKDLYNENYTFALGDTYCFDYTLHVICKKTGFNNKPQKATLLDNLLNADLTEELALSQSELKDSCKKIFGNLNIRMAYKNIIEILWYSQLPCFDTNSNQLNSLIKRCQWKGVELPCAAIFKTFPTDRGMCCTFNMAAAEDIFYNSTYKMAISDMQAIDDDLWNTTTYSTLNPKEAKPIPRAGMNKGLSLILDAHHDILASGSVTEIYKGILAIIGSSNEYPLLNQKNVLIRPGHKNIVGISATDVISTDAIKSVEASKRDCYFSDEYRLALHKQYSQANCLLECQMNYASAMIPGSNSCTPWFLPKNESSDICDPWFAEIFVGLMSNVPLNVCAQCLPDCTFTQYRALVTAVPFRKCNEKNLGVSLLCNLTYTAIDPAMFAQQLINEYDNNSIPQYARRTTNIRMYSNDSSKAVFLKLVGDTYDAYMEDIAEVNFYFKSSTAEQLYRDVSMTWTDFAGQIGGFLGLCNGFSVFSAVEIIFWFTYSLWRNALM